jgi:hypothetical protein
MHAVRVVHVELVDDPLLSDHLCLERSLVELAAEPAQRTIGPALHEPEHAYRLLRGVGAVEDPDRRLQRQPAGGIVLDVQHAPGITSQTARAHPVLGGTGPQSAVDEYDGDAGDLRQAARPDRDHPGRVLVVQERLVVRAQRHTVDRRDIGPQASVADAEANAARWISGGGVVLVGEVTVLDVSEEIDDGCESLGRRTPWSVPPDVASAERREPTNPNRNERCASRPVEPPPMCWRRRDDAAKHRGCRMPGRDDVRPCGHARLPLA